MKANGKTTASTGMCKIGNGLNHPQNKHPPSQLPDTPNNNELIINHFFDSFLCKKYAIKRITKVKHRALIGSSLTQGACTNIGKITKNEAHNLKESGLDKKVFSYESTVLCNSLFNLSFTSKFFVINSSNE